MFTSMFGKGRGCQATVTTTSMFRYNILDNYINIDQNLVKIIGLRGEKFIYQVLKVRKYGREKSCL